MELKTYLGNPKHTSLQGYLLASYPSIVSTARRFANHLAFERGESNQFALENMLIGALYDTAGEVNQHLENLIKEAGEDAPEHLRDIALQASMDVAIERGWETPLEE